MELINSFNASKHSVDSLLSNDHLIVKNYILSKFSDKLQTDPDHLELHENLMDMGLDSSIVISIAEEFEQELDIKLYPTVFFEYRTLHEIIGYFTAEFSDKIVTYYAAQNHNSTLLPLPEEPNASVSLYDRITDFLRKRIATVLEIHPDEINMEENLLDIGLGSSSLVGLAEELEKDINIKLYPTVFFEYQNLSSIIGYFEKEFSKEFELYFASRSTQTATDLVAHVPVVQTPEPAVTQTTPVPDKIATTTRTASQPDNLHAYTLQWEKTTTQIPVATTNGAVIVHFENDSSEIKKHLLRKTFNLLTIPTGKQELSEITLEEATPYNFLLYLNEPPTLFSEAEHATGLVERGYWSIQQMIKKMTAVKEKGQYAITVVVESSDPAHSPLLFAFRGLLKSVSAELPTVKITITGIDSFNLENLEWIKYQTFFPEGKCTIKTQSDAFELTIASENLHNSASDITIKDNSTYLISGGSGKLGQLLGTHLASQAKCTVVLLGRKPQLTANVPAYPGSVVYRSCDVTNARHLKAIVQEVSALYGPVKGVLHAAGVIEDGPLHNKTERQLKNVLEVKIAGLINLDKAVEGQPLDFFNGFSSISSFIGNRGQTDYATANGFMDGYLRQRQLAATKGLKKGKSISINWPLWESGGMMPHQIVIDMMEKSFGLFLLSTQDGLYAYDSILAGNTSQVCIIKGLKDKLGKLLGNISQNPQASPVATVVREQVVSPAKATQERFTGIPTPDYLKTRWSEITLNPLQDVFAPLGHGDLSMPLTRLLEAVNNDYQLRVPATVITNVTTLNDIHTNLVRLLSNTPSRQEQVQTPEQQDLAPSNDYHTTTIRSTSAGKTPSTRDIAIVGMDGRFPMSPDVHTFWKNLENEKDLVAQTPTDRLKWWKIITGFLNHESEEDFMLSGGYLDDVDKFDSDYFNISAREAEVMDPQQRLFLESVWKCIQDAGYTPQALSGTKTGVFAAVSTRDYHELLIINGVTIEPQLSTGLAHSILPNRVSYWLNLHGPSEAIDTACSSSLVALNRAVQAIHNGDCEQAIVGGVNLILSPFAILAFGKTGILGKDGRCKTFDKNANGYARGEGVGAVFLKPLDKAIADGDVIHGVIKGTSVNHGGRGNSLTAPNPALQADVITQAIRRAGCDIRSINYIEAHGTGTALGDPVEIEGLKRAFRTLEQEQNITDSDKNYCGIGAVKSNIGHLEAAAGIAGLIKVLMALKHKKLPASLHIQEINPFINLNKSPFYIVQKTQNWPQTQEGTPRRAGLSSFGFGGTNAHIILEEYIPLPSATPARETYILPFSAPSAEQLTGYLNKFLYYLNETALTDANLQGIAYTLQTGRTDHAYRLVFTVSTLEDLKRQLLQALQKSLIEAPKPVENGSTVSKDAETILVESFIKTGNYQELANVWQQGKPVDWKLLYDQPVQKVSLPTFPLKKTPHWISVPESREHLLESIASSQRAKGTTTEPTIPVNSDIKEFLIREVAALLKKKPEEINHSVSLMEYGLDSILGMTLVKKIEQKLNMPIYVNELLQHDSIDKLSIYLEKESTEKTTAARPDLTLPLPATAEKEDGEKLTSPAVFLLSTPRSGSTLLRAMLMGNTHLFAPPELHLLNFSNLKERKLLLGNTGLGDGLIETIKTLKNISIEEAKAWLEQEESRSLPVKELYRKIQEMTNDMMLVDKSPSYASDINVLRKAEKQFANARYVFLVRHPYAVMESIVRNRFHKFIPGNETDPDKNAENIWYTFNKNIVDFVTELPAGKAITVYYEDLIANPKATLTAITDFLQIPFEDSMLNPYEGNKLIKGLHDNSVSVGDPNFLKHNTVKKEFSSSWKSAYKVLPVLNPATKDFASALGYDIAQDLEVSPVQKEFLHASPADDKWILNHEFSFTLTGENKLNYEALVKAVEQLIDLHPLLQRVYKKEEGVFKWNPNLQQQATVQFEDLSGLDPGNQEARILETTRDIPNRLSICEGPVLAVSIYQTGAQNYRGVLQYHHLYGDGITSSTLLKNLTALLNGSTPEVYTVNESYINYLHTTKNTVLSSPSFPLPDFSLPADHASGSNTFADQAELKQTLQNERIGNKPTDLFVNLGAALASSLGKWTHARQVPLDIRYHGRSIPNLNKTYMNASGFFAYDIPLTVNLEDENPAEAFNKAYSGAKKAGFIPRTHFNPVRLNFQPYQHLLTGDTELRLINSYEYFAPGQERKNQLDCIVRTGSDNLLQFIIRYSSNRYNTSTIENFLQLWIAAFTTSINSGN
jgi:3-oxoacyl-(acyl-carrier-protein) synthase/aryl carrier-like protein